MPRLNGLGAGSVKSFGLGKNKVPGAPTIGAASANTSTSANVAFTAPVNNGGMPITKYTAVSSPGNITGILNQAGSGTIGVSGLTSGTAYTFTVYATNAIGNGPSSAASSSVTPQLAAPSTVDAMLVGGGGGGGRYSSGGGAGGVLVTTISVTSGTTYTIGVGGGGAGGTYNSWCGWWYPGCSGSNSCFNGGSIAYGGGGGGGGRFYSGSGGSGAGGPGFTSMYSCYGNARFYGGSGTAGQGNAGASPVNYCCRTNRRGGGGGGAGRAGGAWVVGYACCCVPIYNGSINYGGIGILNNYSTGNNAYYGGGGGGGGGGPGGAGGGGNGSPTNFCSSVTAGCAYTGGGGGAGALCYYGPQSGGSGIVVIRYPNTLKDAAATTGSPTYLNSGGYKRYTFYGSGSITW